MVQIVDSLITSPDRESVRFTLSQEIFMFFARLVTVRYSEGSWSPCLRTLVANFRESGTSYLLKTKMDFITVTARLE